MRSVNGSASNSLRQPQRLDVRARTAPGPTPAQVAHRLRMEWRREWFAARRAGAVTDAQFAEGMRCGDDLISILVSAAVGGVPLQRKRRTEALIVACHPIRGPNSAVALACPVAGAAA